MHRRTSAFFVITFAFQVGFLTRDVATEGLVYTVGLCWLGLACLTAVFSGLGVDVDRGPVSLSWNGFAGLSYLFVGIAVGWLGTLNGVQESFGLFEFGWAVVGTFLGWCGLQMLRGHDRYRLLAPSETTRDRVESVGHSSRPLAVVRDELMRAIGTFGLLFLPTLFVASVSPALSVTNYFVYAPALVMALSLAALLSWFRIRTETGPHVSQLLDAIFSREMTR
ncbi:hypothetical protein AUR64_05550 [Haloprofundus marisrubri]|uniref:Uncharacterized protein n=1 Tax=Haloprofundus marisrubri TaxID=1514971 RepID=A0A0W1RDH9_9EURY|nr:hypothetical protein [Haloprofundus marisrubri]KTG11173.1 hypothetical protein AUR64_05550 [Haloprofundus marisrubri]